MFNPVRKSRILSAAVVVFGMAWLAGCTETVYKDRPPFNPPPDAANGYLGYYDANDKQTTCGNCHVDHQGDWTRHGHSDAYATLAANPGAQAFCYGCHTVSEQGNARYGTAAVDTAGGWNVKQDKAYYDVQCENCHGPGEIHVTTPDASAPPLARVSADTALYSGTCGECHSGTHHPFVEQWKASRHGRANDEVVDDIVTNPAQYGSCGACHEGRRILQAWGVTSNYVEKNQALTHTNALGVTCAVCHDPHGNDNPGELRFPIDDANFSNNLCTKCHARRFEPAATSSRGPHAPQGPVVSGTAGWWPAGYDTTAAPSTHGDIAANPRYCAGCHVNKFTTTDATTGDPFTSVGHLFRPIPCIDPVSGLPVGGNSCGYTTTERWWGDATAKTGCLQAGCHSSVTTVEAAFSSNRITIAVLANIIWVDTDGSEGISAGDTGYLTQVASTEFSTTDGKITTAEGALFNMRTFGEGRYSNGDKSIGVHNPFLYKENLAVMITALQTAYGLPAPPAPIQSLVRQVLAQAATVRGTTVSSR